MAETSGSRCDRQEYVTDWRMVYSAVGVGAIMIAGGLVWSLYAPDNVAPIATSVANADTTVSDALPFVTAQEAIVELKSVEMLVPWAPLPPEKRLPSKVTQASPPDETESSSKLESENLGLVSGDEADDQAQADASFDVSSRADQFAAELESAVTLDFNPTKALPQLVRGVTRTSVRRSADPLTQEQQFAQLANPSDLAGLPILGEDQCHKSAEEVKELARVSQRMAEINRKRGPQRAELFSLSHEYAVDQEVLQFIAESNLETTSVAPLVQILQVREISARMMLVDALSTIEGPEASRALADRALFDLSREVRMAAGQSLRCRDRSEYQPRLLDAFRYPVAAVAFRAAETLVALGDTEVLPRLEELLDEPDPSDPFLAANGTWQKSELVRVNHLRNCLLCHPRSVSRNDKVRAAAPTPGLPLPQLYYQRSTSEAVRADVTYLRQDFSVTQPVADRGPWPEMQRFDFFVRTRPLTEGERQKQAESAATDAKDLSSYPHREAVLFAVKGLSTLGS